MTTTFQIESAATPVRTTAESPALQPFHSLFIPSDWTVAVMAPHPDDFDAIACTLALLHRRGNPIFVDVLTSGSSGVEDSFCSPPAKEKKESVRESEQEESVIRFGLPPERLRFHRLLEDAEGSPLENEENFRTIFESLRGIRPQLVFMPHGNDSNAGHRRCFRMVKRGLDQLGGNGYFFLNEDPKTISIRPSVFTSFGKTEAETKAALLLCHRSQHSRNLNTRGHGFDERILNFNRSIAEHLKIEAEFAESFEIERYGMEISK
jgi:LmbE family N-acetylglucosaminyl deacetylase